MADRTGNEGDRPGTDGEALNDGPMDASDWFARMRTSDAETYRDEFEAWRRDPANAEAYVRAEENWLLLGGVAPAHLAAHPPSSSPPRRPGWALAAALLLGLSLGAAWLLLGGSRDPVIVASEETGALTLDDGTRVTLIDGAKVTPNYSAAERRVVMTGGRARFDVAHDATRPFRVEAADSITTAAMPTSIGARLRDTLDRESQAYKDIYKQRTAVERTAARAVGAIEHPGLAFEAQQGLSRGA